MLLDTNSTIVSFNITALQGIVVFILLISSLVLEIVLTKKKPSKRIILISIAIGLLLSLLTVFIDSGLKSKLGWPLYFLSLNNSVSVSFNIIFERLILNSSIFILSVLNISWFLSLRKSMKDLKIHILPLLTLFALLTLSTFCLINVMNSNVNKYSTIYLPEDDTEQKLEPKARYLVETKYPEFKDFENQSSFAGKKVFVEVDGDTVYLAYAVEGSGVPIADATCFVVEGSTITKELVKLDRIVVGNVIPGNDGVIDLKTCKMK